MLLVSYDSIYHILRTIVVFFCKHYDITIPYLPFILPLGLTESRLKFVQGYRGQILNILSEAWTQFYLVTGDKLNCPAFQSTILGFFLRFSYQKSYQIYLYNPASPYLILSQLSGLGESILKIVPGYRGPILTFLSEARAQFYLVTGDKLNWPTFQYKILGFLFRFSYHTSYLNICGFIFKNLLMIKKYKTRSIVIINIINIHTVQLSISFCKPAAPFEQSKQMLQDSKSLQPFKNIQFLIG